MCNYYWFTFDSDNQSKYALAIILNHNIKCPKFPIRDCVEYNLVRRFHKTPGKKILVMRQNTDMLIPDSMVFFKSFLPIKQGISEGIMNRLDLGTAVRVL